MTVNGVGGNYSKSYMTDEVKSLIEKYTPKEDDETISATAESESYISDECKKLLEKYSSEEDSETSSIASAPNSYMTEEGKKLLEKYSSENIEETPTITPETGGEIPTGTPSVPQEEENNEEQSDPPLEKETINSFEGEMSNLECTNRYKNRMSRKNPDYNSIYQDLIKDSSVSVYDKYKLLNNLKEKGYTFDEVQAYTGLIADMALQNTQYSIDDFNKINDECMGAFSKLGIFKDSMISGNYGGFVSDSYSVNYQVQVAMYLSSIADLYSCGKFSFENMNEVFNVYDLATSIQHAFSADSESEQILKLISAMPQSALNLNENEPYKTQHVGIEDDYDSLKKVLKECKEGYLTIQEAAYVLSSKYEDVGKLTNDFRSMNWFNQEAYLEKLFEIMQFQTSPSEQAD